MKKIAVLLFVFVISISFSNNIIATESENRYIEYQDLLDNTFMTSLIDEIINDPLMILDDGFKRGEPWIYEITNENGDTVRKYNISWVIQEIETNRFLYTPNDTDIRDSIWVIIGAYIQNITDGGEEILCMDYNEEIKEDWSRKNQQLYPNGYYIQELENPSASLRYNCHSYV